MNKLIEATKVKQKASGLSDKRFASSLGIDRSTWSYLKSGKRNPGMKFLAAIAQNFPDLKPLIDVEIYDMGTSSNALQPSPNRFLRALKLMKRLICRQ